MAVPDDENLRHDPPGEPAPVPSGELTAAGCGDFGAAAARPHARVSRRSGPRMIAVRSERLALAETRAGTRGYLPAIPADSEDRSFD
jgi:hypothetical protein